MLFSVIIPTYNRAEWVTKTIQSVIDQTYRDFEILVVDDGSTDNTGEVIEAMNLPQLRYFKTENRERGAARNFGIQKALGDYVVFIDSDDLMYNHCLTLACRFATNNKLPEIFHIAHEVRDQDNNLIETTSHINSFNRILINGNPMACMNVFVRRDISLQFLFNENRLISGFEDWELWLRLASHYPIIQEKTVSGLMIDHTGRSSNNHNAQLVKSVEIFMQIVLSNAHVASYYRNKLHLFKCGCYTYIALHLAISAHKKQALKYLIKGMSRNPCFIFQKRCFAIFKHLLFA